MEEWVAMLALEIEGLKGEIKAVQEELKYQESIQEGWSGEVWDLSYKERELQEQIARLSVQIEGENPRILFPLIEKSKGKSRNEIIDLVVEAEGGFCLGAAGVPSLGSYAAQLVDSLVSSNWMRLLNGVPSRAWKRIVLEKPHEVVAFHGLCFVMEIEDLCARAEVAMNSVEICVADVPLGPIGLILSGPISLGFSRDCTSHYCPKDGTRMSKADDFKKIIHNPTQEEFDNLPERFFYCEGWMTPSRVLGVFLARHATYHQQMQAYGLASKYDVKIHRAVDMSTKVRDLDL